jgi:hypothetical protein
MSRRLVSLLFTALAASIALGGIRAQSSGSVRLTSLATVGSGPAEHLLYEPHLTADPGTPGRWLAAAIVRGSAPTFPDKLKDQTCAAFVSNDDAKTWTRHEFPVTACYDPWTAITPDGHFLVSMSAASAEFPEQASDGLLVFRSDDGGRTWTDRPVGLGRDHDHPVMVVDSTSSPRRGWIYVSSHRGTRADNGIVRYGPWVARSRDGGKTFDDPVTTVPNNLHNLAEMPVVLSDGTLVESFVDAGFFVAGSDREGSFVTRRAWVLRSTDGGHTFSLPMFVNDACGPPPGFRLSVLAVDSVSDAFRDRLYFACRAKVGGDIVVSTSADGGERWAAPASLPSGRGTPVPEERIPALAVNRQGVIAAAWIDGRSAAGHRCEQTVFLTASLDGGATWLAPVEVSTTPTCSDTTRVANTTGGDYFGLTAARDGSFRLLWSEMRDDASKLVTVSAVVTGAR